MISFNNVSKTIKHNLVLDNINISLKEGKAYLLKGHNGCGKTMLLRMICGLITPETGSITYEKKYNFGVVIENIQFIENETAIFNLKYLARIRNCINEDVMDRYLKMLNLYEYKRKKVKVFSLGMKQRLGICQAIMEDQDVILLDEPFNALDIQNCEVVKNIILEMKKRNKIIVIAAHGISETLEKEIFDETFTMNNGTIL